MMTPISRISAFSDEFDLPEIIVRPHRPDDMSWVLARLRRTPVRSSEHVRVYQCDPNSEGDER